MQTEIIIEIVKLIILALAVLALVYLIRDVIDVKIGALLFVITNAAIPNLSEQFSVREFSILTLVYLLIYFATLIGAIMIVNNSKKTSRTLR